MNTDKSVPVWIEDSTENSLTMVEKENISQVREYINKTMGKPIDSLFIVQVFKTPTSREKESDPLSPITKLNTLVNSYDDGTQSYIRLRVKIKTTIITYSPGGTPIPSEYFHLQNEGGNKFEGIRGNKLVVPRNKLVEEIFNTMLENPIVIIRSPPFTGKTSVGQLLEIYLNEKYKDQKPVSYVRRISFGWHNKGFHDLWTLYTGLSFRDWLKVSTKKHVYLIIDEAQAIYKSDDVEYHSQFWPFLKCLTTNIHILILASYGEKQGKAHTPFVLNDTKVLGSNFLFFNHEEFTQLLDFFSKQYFQIPKEIYNFLWTNSIGHVGIVNRSLHGIMEKFSPSGQIKSQVDFAKVFNYLMSGEYSQYLAESRGSPSYDVNFSQNQLKILDLVTENGYIKASHIGNPDLESLIKDGYLIMSEEQNSHFIFPSPLFRRCYLVKRYGKNWPSDEKIEKGLIGLKQLIFCAIKYFRPYVISSKFSARASLPNENVQSLESVWQMELYCAFSNILGPIIVPNAGGRNGSDGKIDFYVEPPYNWGIELLSEGKGTDEHLNRFKTTKTNTTSRSGQNATYIGIYVPLLDTMIKDWIIIDFSSEMLYQNNPPNIADPNLCIITYSTDFKTYKIHYQDGKVDQIIL
ncbi:hypothetical protein DLAC_07419 [Tieghemostelium lacteum]|uniref:Uncharacterized protein n=1 Tax=Tieghemostelium lacteum TaxID=361077 RepID=A0A151ZCP2_TIELA|nr:hypothetical protein DLAC_07419 [Tieghemostelium lacteum]|eukprot:KYQ91644.1 hypothetical protein DLAC_07419 [Tieghemostelium lacteum]